MIKKNKMKKKNKIDWNEKFYSDHLEKAKNENIPYSEHLEHMMNNAVPYSEYLFPKDFKDESKNI